MTHDQAIDTLLGTLVTSERAVEPPPELRHEAESHVITCSACWATIRLVHELLPAQAEASPAVERYGCSAVRSQLYLLAGLEPAEARQRHPEMLHHLRWCAECRLRAAMLLRADERRTAAAQSRASKAEPTAPAACPQWHVSRESSGRQVRSVTDTLRVLAREGLAHFARIPAGLASGPALQPEAVRGERGSTPTTITRNVRVLLQDDGPVVELISRSRGADRIALEVSLSATPPFRGAVHLREQLENRSEIVAAHTAESGTSVVLEAIPAGRYVLEIVELPQGSVYRLPLVIEIES